MEKERFTGETMGEALAAARARFGPDVKILTGRRARKRSDGFEVLACRDRQGKLFPMSADTTELLKTVLASVKGARARAGQGTRARFEGPHEDIVRNAPAGRGHLEGGRGRLGTSGPAAYRLSARRPAAAGPVETASPAGEADAPAGNENDLRDEVQRLRKDLNLLIRETVGARGDVQLEEALRAEGFSPAAAREISEARPDRDVLRDEIRNRLLRGTPADEKADTGPRAILLAGPSGAGKTTTLAKIAAQLRYDEGRTIAFVQADPTRVGAEAQLGEYAELIGGRFKAAASPEEVRSRAIEFARDCDIVCIDTPGSWSRRPEVLETIQGEIRRARIRVDVKLCLPLTGDRSLHEAVLAGLAGIPDIRLIWTKADEALRWGHAIDTAAAYARSVSFITTGEGVPEEIERAVPETIADECLARIERRLQ